MSYTFDFELVTAISPNNYSQIIKTQITRISQMLWGVFLTRISRIFTDGY